ncbi:MAG: zinc ribbon domain-containing protein [Thermoplasmata archaeon]|nr:zinc ribbon domain-containing protein [Thermoplasmata archaeon]
MSAEFPPPPPDQRTIPDQLEPPARDSLELLEGEQVSRVWRTSLGFLVLTNLRVLSTWHRPTLLGFGASDWLPGLGFFLYALRPPRVLAHRLLELDQGPGDRPETARFLLQDPEEVCATIDAALPTGRAAWEARRARMRSEMQSRQATRAKAAAGSVREIVRVVVRVPCSYCGALMDDGAPRCPSCGATQH